MLGPQTRESRDRSIEADCENASKYMPKHDFPHNLKPLTDYHRNVSEIFAVVNK